MIYLGIAATMTLMFLIVMDMIMYSPGEKRRIDQERRVRVHTKSHHHKLGSRR
jgi:cbb3-type cytochrome oxidase subunit 3